MTILVTGGAGFIGSNFLHFLIHKVSDKIVNLDSLTYAGNIRSIERLNKFENYNFIKGSICDKQQITSIFKEHQITKVINFAAESHVDRSILGPEEFINTNINGTFNLLEVSRLYWSELPAEYKKEFRFLHVSTDEVYGSLDLDEPPFKETNPYQPNSPYAASKASSDHLVRAYYHTYDLPVITSNCSNNYGPYQFPEKLIPLIITNALSQKPLPIYGDGMQVRDWLYVTDHCEAILKIITEGAIGETYNIGGNNEKTNLEVVQTICSILDNLKKNKQGSYSRLITYVKDRPGHDRRYAIDSEKIKKTLNWKPKETFKTGMTKTINWYLENSEWLENITSGSYRDWIKKQY